MNKLAFALFFLFACSLPASAQTKASCVVQDEEEYRVIAAVLFPNEPDVPDRYKEEIAKRAYLESARVHLDGFHWSSYSLWPSTITQSKLEMKPDGDAVLVNDYNRKNEVPCDIDLQKLKAFLPEGNSVAFVQREQEGESRLGGGGSSSVSRVAFNKERTVAMVAVRHIAGREMGVGYRVFLEKSPKTGKWIITGAARNFIS